jgi:hypothetical protein
MPERWKMPPLVKVYEALGALGDGRVRIESDSRALVGSSDASKTYEVETKDGAREVSSNDNASYWQGYLGYPGIAVLIERGAIHRPPDKVIDALAGIPWKEINTRFRNDYAKTIAEVLRIAERSGHDPNAIRAAAEAVLNDLKKFAPTRGPRRRPPAERKKPARR